MLDDPNRTRKRNKGSGLTRYGYRFLRLRVEIATIYFVKPSTITGRALASIEAHQMARGNIKTPPLKWREVPIAKDAWLDCNAQVDFNQSEDELDLELKRLSSKKLGLINENCEIKTLDFVPRRKEHRLELAERLRELADDVENGWDVLDEEDE